MCKEREREKEGLRERVAGCYKFYTLMPHAGLIVLWWHCFERIQRQQIRFDKNPSGSAYSPGVFWQCRQSNRHKHKSSIVIGSKSAGLRYYCNLEINQWRSKRFIYLF